MRYAILIRVYCRLKVDSTLARSALRSLVDRTFLSMPYIPEFKESNTAQNIVPEMAKEASWIKSRVRLGVAGIA